MKTIHGFTLLNEAHIPELNSLARLYRHEKTGADLLSLENADENKVFSINFRTPRADSTGLPHIMEHTVLCGSRKYPVKDPFITLAKSSLNTFLNAMTYPDKTCYPVASQNVQDFYNLIDVYLDAVFYPRISREFFDQEGWHFELDAPDAPLAYRGIVYNEMKGNYSSPDYLAYEAAIESLFPDTSYGFDPGGDPQVIPELTYAEFRAFHRDYYHPSNARLYFYGDDPPEERLRLADAYLRDFEARALDNQIVLQTPFDAPRRVHAAYPAGDGAADDDAAQQKAIVTVNWLLPENDNPTLTYTLRMLDYILTGIAASPLRKALIDSGLGEDIIGAGLDNELRQLYYSVGLRGVEVADVKEVETLILATLGELVEHGLDPLMVEAAINTMEFRLREQNYDDMPRGLGLMLRALTIWLHDGDPLAALRFEDALTEIKARSAAPGYFEGLIRQHLLDNPHRVTVYLEPDATLQKRWEAQEQVRLAEARAAMRPEDLAEVVATTRRLREMQETPDPPEALATIPALTLADLDKDIRRVPTEQTRLHAVPVIRHDLFTNGLLYLDVGFDLRALPAEWLPYASLFCAALLEIGTEREDYVQLTQRIARQTGGIETELYITQRHRSAEVAAWQFLRGKATAAQAEALLAILHDLLLTVKLDNRERFAQMLLEEKAQLEARLTPEGHRVVINRLRSQFHPAHWAREQMEGVSYLFFLRRLIEEVQQDWPAVLAQLEAVRHALINRAALLCHVTADAATWAVVEKPLDAFLAALPTAPFEPAAWTPALAQIPEGLTIPAQVNYVAKGANLYALGYALHGSVEVIVNHLRTTWLWERVRLQGGAYGGFCTFDAHAGAFTYASYRDPNLVKTLENYDQAAAFLRALDLSPEELTKSIIGAIGNLDAYELPEAKGFSALQRHLAGYSDEARQQHRDELLGATLADFHAFAAALERLNATGTIVVLGAGEGIEQAGKETGIAFEMTKVL